MRAELVRCDLHEVDIKITNGEDMQVLQWRRKLLHDEILLNGRVQMTSYGLWGREKVYGLVFNRDENGEGGTKVMLIVDPQTDSSNWFASKERLAGVRLETATGPVLAYGTLDPRALEKPSTFSDWMKKTIGMEW